MDVCVERSAERSSLLPSCDWDLWQDQDEAGEEDTERESEGRLEEVGALNQQMLEQLTYMCLSVLHSIYPFVISYNSIFLFLFLTTFLFLPSVFFLFSILFLLDGNMNQYGLSQIDPESCTSSKFI